MHKKTTKKPSQLSQCVDPSLGRREMMDDCDRKDGVEGLLAEGKRRIVTHEQLVCARRGHHFHELGTPIRSQLVYVIIHVQIFSVATSCTNILKKGFKPDGIFFKSDVITDH